MQERRTEAILTALILTAVIAIPTASQNVDYTSDKTSTPIVDSTSNTEIDIAVSPEVPTTARMEKHGTLYKVRETPSKRVETLSTPSAVLKIKITNESRLYQLETAYGELNQGWKKGRKIFRYTGMNRSEAVEKLSEMRNSAGEYREDVKEEMVPEVDIKVTKSKSDDPDERAMVENEDSRNINLRNWKVVNSDGDEFTFEDLELEIGQRVYIYAAEESELNVTEKQGERYIYGTGTDWDYDSEQASLFNPDDVLIEQDSY